MSGLPPAFTGFAFPGLENLRNDIYPAIDAANTPSLRQPGKVVLVTGAGRGIGRGIALQYAHAKVASIILVARSSKELDEVEASIQKINSSIKVYKKSISVTDDAAVAQLAQEVTSNEGRLDILVNNAGASADWVPIDQGKPAQWWGAMEVNLKGPYLFIQAFLPLLTATNEKTGAGVHVINITSIGAHSLDPDASSYMISKLAVLRLSEFLHVGHAGKGIVSVGVHPGGVVTAMSDQEERLKPYLNDSTDLCGGFLVWLTSQKREWTGGRYLASTWDVEKLDSMKEEIIEGDKLKVRMVV